VDNLYSRNYGGHKLSLDNQLLPPIFCKIAYVGLSADTPPKIVLELTKDSKATFMTPEQIVRVLREFLGIDIAISMSEMRR